MSGAGALGQSAAAPDRRCDGCDWPGTALAIDGVSDVAEIAWTGSEIIVVGVLVTILGLEVWQVWRWRR